jgi:hypothetical protein
MGSERITTLSPRRGRYTKQRSEQVTEQNKEEGNKITCKKCGMDFLEAGICFHGRCYMCGTESIRKWAYRNADLLDESELRLELAAERDMTWHGRPND